MLTAMTVGGAASWRDTSFTGLTGIDVPIVLAPLAGGPSTPQLAAAVSAAGGLGFLGAAYLTPDRIRAEVAEVRARTDRPFGVNLFVGAPVSFDQSDVVAAWDMLAPYRAELGMADAEMPSTFAESFDDQAQVLLEERVPVVTFTFGVPDASRLEAFHAAGTLVGAMATTVEEARTAAVAGCDLVVAQGAEAGGHRGAFLGDPARTLVGVMALVPQCVDAVDIPVLAAGGIMDGRAVAASLALGAAAAQLGTAFLCCPEAGTSAPYRQALAVSTGETVVTTAISGRAARGLPNRLTEELAGRPVPPYPVMNALTSGLRRRAAELGRSELLSLWAGQGVQAIRPVPAAELFRLLVEETDAALGGVWS